MATNTLAQTTAPLGYTVPSFPSLYWPFKAAPGVANYLYHTFDIWRFTLLWTLIIYAGCHVVVVVYAVLMQLGKGKKAWKYVWTFPIIYCATAGVEALLAGSLVGLILGALYNAGFFRMSTWFPFIWGLTNVLVLITSSFSIQGAL